MPSLPSLPSSSSLPMPPPWVSRGTTLAVLHAAATVAVAKYAVFHPTDDTVVRGVALLVLLGTALLWSGIDAWLGAERASRTWFVAALVTGGLSAVLAVVGRALLVDGTGIGELASALTGGAAFSALLVLVPAGLGLSTGGRLSRVRSGGASDTAVSKEKTNAEDDRRDAPRPSPRRRETEAAS